MSIKNRLQNVKNQAQGVKGVLILLVLFALWCNNIHYLVDSQDRYRLRIRDVVSVIGVTNVPVGVINGAVYLYEESVSR